MFYDNINPVLINLGFIKIRWYGIAWSLGLISIYILLNKYKKQTKIKDNDSFIIILTIFTILFSKIFSIIYHPNYLKLGWKLLRIGFSSVGAFVGFLLGIRYLKKKEKFNLGFTVGLILIGMILGSSLGRFANFTNKEFIGYHTTLPWCVNFGDGCRHPVQIYESITYFIISLIMLIILQNENKNKKKDKKRSNQWFLFEFGFNTYISSRFILEFFKDIVRFKGLDLTQWQIIAIYLIYIGIKLYINTRKHKTNNKIKNR